MCKISGRNCLESRTKRQKNTKKSGKKSHGRWDKKLQKENRGNTAKKLIKYNFVIFA